MFVAQKHFGKWSCKKSIFDKSRRIPLVETEKMICHRFIDVNIPVIAAFMRVLSGFFVEENVFIVEIERLVAVYIYIYFAHPVTTIFILKR